MKAQMSIHRDIEINAEEVIEKFGQKNRRTEIKVK